MSPRTESETRRQPHSLRRRLLFSMGAGLIAALVLLSVGLWFYARDTANRAYDQLLTGAALAILERTAVGASGATADIPYSALQMVGLMQDDRVFYRVIGPDGETVTGTDGLPLPHGFAPSAGPAYFDAPYSGVAMRFAVQGRLIASRGGAEWVAVQIGDTRIARDALQRQVVARGLAGLVSIAAIGIFFVWLGINRALRPLARIEHELDLREHTDLTPLSAEPPREVERLIEAINGFMSRLKVGEEHAQTFIADVAHQTRTSLTAVQGHLDLAATRTGLDEMRAQLQKADAQARRTVRLTNQLLARAMIIHRAEYEPLQPVRLGPVLRAVAEEALRGTMTRDIEFELLIDPAAQQADTIRGDPVSLREALRNLIDNAVKHGPEQNTVAICLDRLVQDGQGVLRVAVEDAGPGIPEAQRDAALTRFHSLAPDAGGSGLGLAIVKAVAASHHASMSLGVSRYGGLRIAIDFPTAHQN